MTEIGANILLAYFHYCNRGTYPFLNGCKDSDLHDLAGLDEETISFVKWTRNQAELHSQFHQDCHKGTIGKSLLIQRADHGE